MTDKKSKVFISYSQKDRIAADEIYAALNTTMEVWLDIHRLYPGAHLSTEITEGINTSDYYLLLISENSNASPWVKREIAAAIELADKKKLAVIPFLIEKASIPLDFKGLLYIDGSKSIKDGLRKLIEYFHREDTSTKEIDGGRVIIRKSADDAIQMLTKCQMLLGELKTRDLRHHICTKITLEDVKVIWFDLFESRMSDDVQIQNLALSCVELIARCDREGERQTLLELLCRNHPRIAQSIRP